MPAWLRHYRWREDGWPDALAALLVTAMLIPQALSYALLAGMPLETGLYASILPPVAYALFGSSRSLSVGPMAVTSLMTANIIHAANLQLGIPPVQAATLYALLSGLFLLLLGILRFGFVAKLISTPVLAGFNNASVLVIVLPQLWLLADAAPWAPLHTAANVWRGPALWIGLGALLTLWLGRHYLPRWLQGGLSTQSAQQWSKATPLLLVAISILAASAGWLPASVHRVGFIPQGLPDWHWPLLSWHTWQFFVLPAALMALVIYVNAIAVGQALAQRHGDTINPNQELLGLGSANVAAAFSGGFPVTGGMSRSAVNDDAGARSQMASLFTAALMAAAALWLAPLFAHLPKTILAAIIIASVGGMFQAAIFRQLWQYSRGEWGVMMATFLTALLWRVDLGIAVGMLASFALLISRSAKPHLAEIGRLPDCESFRNIHHFEVITWPHILSLRIDAGLQFFNHDYICTSVLQRLQAQPGIRHVVLQCHGINTVDYSGARALLQLRLQLAAQGIGLTLSEVKIPVKRQLERLSPPANWHQSLFLTHHQAIQTILASDPMPANPPATCPTGTHSGITNIEQRR